MIFALDIKPDTILRWISKFDHVRSLEIDHLGPEVLDGRLPVVDDEANDVIKTCLESLRKFFHFSGRLVDGIFLALDLHSLLSAVDLNGLVFRATEFCALHVWKLDEIGEDIAGTEFTAAEAEE